MTAAPRLTKLQFRRKLRQVGLSQRRFAFMVQMDISAVNRWATRRQLPPHWVRLFLDAMIENAKLSRAVAGERDAATAPAWRPIGAAAANIVAALSPGSNAEPVP